MANRCYVYATDAPPEPDKRGHHRGLAEFADGIPITYLLLASGNVEHGPRPCMSAIVDAEVAVVGDYDAGVKHLMAFLAALHRDGLKDDPEFEAALWRTHEFLKLRRATYVLLEPIEIFWMNKDDYVAQADELVSNRIPHAMRELADRIRNPSPLPEAFVQNWRQRLGLFWSESLYYSFD